MKLINVLSLVFFMAGPASAQVDCEITKALNESQFYQNVFKNVQGGFNVPVYGHLFSYQKSSDSNIATVTIKDLATSKEVSSSGEIAFGRSLRVYLDDGFRVIASMKCY